MKKIFFVIIAILFTGCAVAPTSKTNNISDSNHASKNTPDFLAEMQSKGLFCQRLSQWERDPRLKVATDGTLNEVEFNSCIAQSEGLFCVAGSGILVLSQYGKVISVRNDKNTNNCIWQ